MKTQRYILMLDLMFILVMFTGCKQSLEGATTPSVNITTIPIRTVSPTATMRVTLTPTFTNTSIPQSTSSIEPTLPAESARQRLLKLLATNAGCRLPCLWGITPGKSSYLDARSMLMPLNGIAENKYSQTIRAGAISPLYVEGEDLRLYTRIAYLYDSDGIVDRIDFRAEEQQKTVYPDGNLMFNPVYASTSFAERTAYYSLSHVLTEQGIPTSVMVKFSGLSGSVIAGGLEIVLLYPNQGIWINYVTTMYNRDHIKAGCPAIANVHMNLYPPGDPFSFYDLLDTTDWGVTEATYMPIEEVTSMSVEEFYKTFRNPTDACLETPSNIWPTPELFR